MGRRPEEAATVLFNSGAQKLKRQQHFYAYIYLNNIVDALVDLSKVRERIQPRKGQVSKNRACFGPAVITLNERLLFFFFLLIGTSVPTLLSPHYLYS